MVLVVDRHGNKIGNVSQGKSSVGRELTPKEGGRAARRNDATVRHRTLKIEPKGPAQSSVNSWIGTPRKGKYSQRIGGMNIK